MKIVLIEIRGTSKYLHNGLGFLAGNLGNNHKVKIFDLNVLDWNKETLLGALKKEKPDLIGFSMKSFNLKNVLSLAKKVKLLIPCKLAVGGPHITIAAEEFFDKNNNDIFDFGFQGEADISFARFCDNFEKPEEYKNIPGLIYKSENEWIFNKPLFVDNLNALKFPNFDCFENKVNFEKQEGYPLLTSRGCPYQCIYCSVAKVSGKKWRFRSPENIILELREAIKKYNIKSFKIMDDNFTLDIKRAKEFCGLLMRENLALKWSCPNGLRADRIDEELARLMKKSGCESVSLGIESGDEKVFGFINKGETLEDIKNAASILNKHNLKVSGFFIIGLPFESTKSTKKSLKLIEELGLHSVKWNMLVPYPGTFLWDWILKNGRFLKNFTEGQHFLKEKSIEPVFETDDYSSKERQRAYKVANLSVGAYSYVFQKPKNKLLFYLKYIFYLLRYNPVLLFKKITRKLKTIIC